ncbi:MAG TPA: hypothetical protein VGM37_14935 [Armatimonadota bacterium]|jgi:hypothetical protein
MLPETPNSIVLQRLTAGIIFPPVGIDRQALANFYAQASAPFEFTQFNLLPDGARLAVSGAPESDDLIIQPSRAQVNMALPPGVAYEAVVGRAMAQFDAARQFLRLSQYQAFGVKIVGAFSLGEACADFLEHRLIRQDAPLDRLGLGRVGTGFRFNFHREGVWDVRIEPFFRDVSQIYVEVDAQKTDPFNDLKAAQSWMEDVERYFRRELLDFLQSLPA